MIRTQKVPCNLCGSRDSTFLYHASDRLHGIGGTFTYVRCKECGLVYMNPQVVGEDIEQLYPADYAPHSTTKKGTGFKARSLPNRIMKIPLIARLLKKLMNVKIAESVYRKVNQQSRILDVGCGAGSFLNTVRTDKACEVYGVDISETAVREAKSSFGLDIFKGTIAEAPLPNAYFDIITAWWYLEHIPDPHATVAVISSLLKHDGYFIVGVPNFNSLYAKHFNDKWYHLDCPRHLCIWTPQTITSLLEKHGLSVVRIIYDKTPWGLLGSLQYLLYDNNINPKYRNRLRQSSLLWILFLPWTILVSLLKRSDIMVIYARKVIGESD
ncbi:MAG: class I SAM-dependent methyltransferase [Planctomycetota bacterium]